MSETCENCGSQISRLGIACNSKLCDHCSSVESHFYKMRNQWKCYKEACRVEMLPEIPSNTDYLRLQETFFLKYIKRNGIEQEKVNDLEKRKCDIFESTKLFFTPRNQDARPKGNLDRVKSFPPYNNFYKQAYKACQEGNIDFLKKLLQRELDIPDEEYGSTPLSFASQAGHKQIVEFLIKNGANVNHESKSGRTPLCFASEKGHKEVVEILIDNGAKADLDKSRWFSPILIASKGGHKEIVKILFRRGWASIHHPETGKLTPIYVASEYGHKEIVEMLLSFGSNLNVKDSEGVTPLAISSYKGHTGVVSFLLDHGADANCEDCDGQNPLMVALDEGNTYIAKLLTKETEDLDHMDKEGNTALSIARKNGNEFMVEFLIKNGAKNKGMESCMKSLKNLNMSDSKDKGVESCRRVLKKMKVDSDEETENEVLPSKPVGKEEIEETLE